MNTALGDIEIVSRLGPITEGAAALLAGVAFVVMAGTLLGTLPLEVVFIAHDATCAVSTSAPGLPSACPVTTRTLRARTTSRCSPRCRSGARS